MAFQRLVKAGKDCFNKRNLNYMCEVGSHQLAWTLESGLCWPDKGYDDPRYPPWNMINTSKLSNVNIYFDVPGRKVSSMIVHAIIKIVHE
jgi:hypothetical protein